MSIAEAGVRQQAAVPALRATNAPRLRSIDLTGDQSMREVKVVPGQLGPEDLAGEGVEDMSSRDELRDLQLNVAVSGRDLTPDELIIVREQVAQAGYGPASRTPAGGRLRGLTIQGQVLTASGSRRI